MHSGHQSSAINSPCRVHVGYMSSKLKSTGAKSHNIWHVCSEQSCYKSGTNRLALQKWALAGLYKLKESDGERSVNSPIPFSPVNLRPQVLPYRWRGTFSARSIPTAETSGTDDLWRQVRFMTLWRTFPRDPTSIDTNPDNRPSVDWQNLFGNTCLIWTLIEHDLTYYSWVAA